MKTKRVLDVLLSTMVLIAAFPLIAGIALAIYLTDGFPILFRQQRIGRGGCDFTLLKFRTMNYQPIAERGSFEAGDTSRVTRIGAPLRHWKLDELPQFWNVLRGDMSLVGPRPEVRKWVDAYPARWAQIHSVRPGITDPASIAYRHEETLLADADDPEAMYAETILPAKLSIYESYLNDGVSARRDAEILVRTLSAVIGSSKEAA